MNETNWTLGAHDGLPASATPADTLWVQQARTDYLGGVTLEAMGGGPARLRLQVAGGFVTIEPAQRPRYHYYVGDHLGSVRLVVDEYGEVEQYNDFYAYGSQTSHGRGAGLQPYKFTGKELETTHGQCLYDFGARWLDPLLPRWTSTDPLAEAYYHVSPYAYCAGNPVSYVDPDGMGINDVNELEGATIVGERKKRYVMDKSWFEWRMTYQREQEQTSKISDDNEPGGSGRIRYYRDKNGKICGEIQEVVVVGYLPSTRQNFNIDAAVLYLNAHAYATYSRETCGRCARAVRLALEAGGINTNPHPISAKDYEPYLKKWGFTKIPRSDYDPIKGDIRVFQNYPGGSKHGHIDMYNGKQWVSDYFEKNDFPGNGYRLHNTFSIFRWEY